MLNLKSFSSGRSKEIEVTSWSGTAATSAREVFLPEVLLGNHRLKDLRLPAIDLSPIGNACGGKIDGILDDWCASSGDRAWLDYGPGGAGRVRRRVDVDSVVTTAQCADSCRNGAALLSWMVPTIHPTEDYREARPESNDHPVTVAGCAKTNE